MKSVRAAVLGEKPGKCLLAGLAQRRSAPPIRQDWPPGMAPLDDEPVPPPSEPESAAAEDRPTRPYGGSAELRARAVVDALLRGSPIPPPHLPKNLPLYLRRETLADVLAADRLYQRILGLPGAVMEFGAFWGRRLALFLTLRELYEPHNMLRRIVGFDTFTGLAGLSARDGMAPEVRPG